VIHSNVCQDAFKRVTWLFEACDMPHSSVWHDSFKRVTWLIQTCDMTHSNVSHDSFKCVPALFRAYHHNWSSKLIGICMPIDLEWGFLSTWCFAYHHNWSSRICTRCFEGGPLPPGSWLGSCQIGDPPGGGVCSMMKVDKHMDSMLWIGCFRMPIDLELEVYG